MRVKDEDDTWLVLTSWGRRGFFESQLLKDTRGLSSGHELAAERHSSRLRFVQLARDSFLVMAGRQEQTKIRAVAKRDQISLCAL